MKNLIDRIKVFVSIGSSLNGSGGAVENRSGYSGYVFSILKGNQGPLYWVSPNFLLKT